MGWRRAQSARYGAARSMVGSAQQIDIGSIPPNRPYSAWQAEAWNGYEKVGEIHFGLGLVANIMSRVRLFAAAVIDSDQAPMIANDASEKNLINSELALAAQKAMDDFVANELPNNLRAFSLNVSVPGECYLIHLPDREHPENKSWVIRSTDEIRVTTGGVELVPMRGAMQDQRILPKDTFIARLWRPSGRYSQEPDSSMVGIADPIEELLILQRLVRSATRTRLNAGLLFVPDGITAVSATVAEPDPDTGMAAVADPGGEFLAELMDAMITPVSDEGAVNAVVPMVVTGPSELGDKISHKTFERSSDDWLVNRAERALERILQGLDIPKEVVTGLANVKYANAIVIDENLYRANIEPLCLMLADSLTQAYLKPVLRAMNQFDEADLDRITVWYDPSEIVTRPSKDQDATEGFDRYLLSPGAWRREHGFADTDAPSEAELAFMLLTSKGVLPEDVTASLLNVVLPTVLGGVREQAMDNSVVPFPQKARDLLAVQGQKADQVGDAAQGQAAQ